ncbi:hypothetical protein GCM10009789_67010 [Kribbella sancticallisti]|uniref:Uncharacterized protein n=1 Tax=Kribbella sancticallisti TaxID=460087 RepID=A0ABP4Q7V2_9ACTN
MDEGARQRERAARQEAGGAEPRNYLQTVPAPSAKAAGGVTDAPAHMPATVPMIDRVARVLPENIRSYRDPRWADSVPTGTWLHEHRYSPPSRCPITGLITVATGSEGWGFESLRARQQSPSHLRWMAWALSGATGLEESCRTA